MRHCDALAAGHPAIRWWGRQRWRLLPLITLLGVTLPQLFGGKYKVDSGHYAGVSKLAWTEGHFWTLMAGHTTYFKKPPLTFWIHGGFMRLFGDALWVVRLPNLLAMAGCVLMTVLIGKAVAGRRAGLLAGIVLVLSHDFLRFAKRFVLDYWHMLFILLAVWLIVKTIERRAWRGALGAGAAIGLALMVKPMVALVALPILGVWCHAVGRPRWGQLTASGLIAVAVAAPWHASMIATHGEAFTGVYFGGEVGSRAAGGHGAMPWHWYAGRLATTYWPWLATLALGVLAWTQRHAFRRDRKAALLTLVWCGVWLILLSSFAYKRDRYLMHVLPLLTLPTALWLARWAPAWLRRGPAWRADVFSAAERGRGGGRAAAPNPLPPAPPAHRQQLFDLMADHPDRDWYIQRHKALIPGGEIYMETGIWPKPIGWTGPDKLPAPPGAMVIKDADSGNTFPPDWPILLRNSRFVVARRPDAGSG